MEKKITFTCPQCGSHQLLLIESSLQRFDVTGLTFEENGRLRASNKAPYDSLRGEELGYRCKECRHPDASSPTPSNSYLWPKLEDIIRAGAITWPGSPTQWEHHCMLCQPDGTLSPLIVLVAHAGTLSFEERQTILEREHQPQAIILCQDDPGIQSFDCNDWSTTKKHFLG